MHNAATRISVSNAPPRPSALRRARDSCTVHSRLIFTAVGNLPRHPRSFRSARWRRSHLLLTGRTDRFKLDLNNTSSIAPIPSLHIDPPSKLILIVFPTRSLRLHLDSLVRAPLRRNSPANEYKQHHFNGVTKIGLYMVANLVIHAPPVVRSLPIAT